MSVFAFLYVFCSIFVTKTVFVFFVYYFCVKKNMCVSYAVFKALVRSYCPYCCVKYSISLISSVFLCSEQYISILQACVCQDRVLVSVLSISIQYLLSTVHVYPFIAGTCLPGWGVGVSFEYFSTVFLCSVHYIHVFHVF